jgi:hypothetical protein
MTEQMERKRIQQQHRTHSDRIDHDYDMPSEICDALRQAVVDCPPTPHRSPRPNVENGLASTKRKLRP